MQTERFSCQIVQSYVNLQGGENSTKILSRIKKLFFTIYSVYKPTRDTKFTCIKIPESLELCVCLKNDEDFINLQV